MFGQFTDRLSYNTNAVVRVRNNSYAHRYQLKKELIKHSIPSKTLKKQLNNSIVPQLTILPPIKTDTLIKTKKMAVPLISGQTNKKNHQKTSNPENSITENINQLETDLFKNANSLHQSKASFRTKKFTKPYLPIKTNFSSVFPSQQELPHDENLSKNECNKLQTQFHDFAQTSTTQRTLIRKNRENKCLIAVTRKLPFSLERKSKRKYTQKTDFSNTNQEIFDLDISVIVDENQGPDTPFIRKSSALAEVFNFA